MTKDFKKLKVLLIEPYYGGSHKQFLEGLMRETPFEFTLMDMPARKWQWRMRLAAPMIADQLRQSGKQYDRVLCSTFIDVATLRGLGPRWLSDVPVLTYFHENQFAYPVQSHVKQDIQYALINMTTAMASDSLAFNSAYNRDSFLEGIRALLQKTPDGKPADPCLDIREKSHIISPAMDYGDIDNAPATEHNDTPVILWNHRWEHDKGPEVFFHSLYELDEDNVNFNLIVLGESFSRQPAIFNEAREKLADKIIHFGYAESRADYTRLLRQGTIGVSTANHEFFGMSVMEAVRAGCRPLLPRRLSYPELFGDEFLYDEGTLTERLRKVIKSNEQLAPSESIKLTEPHSWQSCRQKYIDWIGGAERS